MSSSKDNFEEAKFMKELIHLRDTQEAIQTLSAWCLKNKKFSYKIARCWVKCVKKVKIDQKLALFYLLNDVVQHSKRKNYNEFIDRFQSVLKEAIPHLKDESIAGKVRRVINIWAERQIFEEKFIKELVATLDVGKKTDNDIVETFQPHQICTQIKIMKALEDDSEYKLKTLKEADINLVDFDEAKIRQNLKDREHGKDYIKEVEESRKCLEDYIKAVDREITKRRQVKDLLEQARKYYNSLYDEAEIVANAYTVFGNKVKNVQNKLEVQLPELDSHSNKSVASLLSDADLSPMPSPDYDAPSPEPNDQETELRLPDEEAIPMPSTPEQPKTEAAPATSDMSISEYLTKLAQGEAGQNGGHFFYQDPPAATAWPAPKEWPEETDPVPEWQIQTVDEEPPDVISDDVTPNLAFARLQHKQGALVEVQPIANDAMEVVISDDEPEILEHNSPHGNGKLSLQDRLRNLAGVSIPPNPHHEQFHEQMHEKMHQHEQIHHQQPHEQMYEQMHEQMDHPPPTMHHQQPHPRPFFNERSPGGRGRGRGGPRPPSNNFGGNRGFGDRGHRRPFRGNRGFGDRGGDGRGGRRGGHFRGRW